LIVIGDGYERKRLEELAQNLDIMKHIIFVGSIDNNLVKNYLEVADVFLSTYDVSNIGNPLLEAIKANKIIFTLNNGDTGAWIKHRKNGFIYDIDESTIDRMAHDIVEVINTPELRDSIKQNIKITEKEKLWTWDERLQAEYSEIDKLVSPKKDT
jgi:glycosyltransferase involved in cell wall biosynthesis